MPQRRLVLLVAVLVGLLAVGAGLAARPQVRAGDPPRTADRTPVELRSPPAKTLRAGARRPRTVSVPAGEELQLTVTGVDAPDVVELAGLDRQEQIAPDTPAVFDLLADRPGTYPVVLVGGERRLGALRVTPAR